MEEDLRTYLLSQSGVTAQVGTRIHWRRRPQGGALPVVVMRIASSIPTYSMDGDSNLDRDRVQIDVYGESVASVTATVRAIENALDSHQGNTGSTSFRGVFRQDRNDDVVDGPNEADDFIHTRLDYYVHHKST